jgi:hypothetical protein
MTVFIGAIKNKPKYGTYILTAFETEIEKFFNSKKDMLKYLSTTLFAKKESNSIAVVAFSIDKDGDKTFIKTKYSKDDR